MPKIWQIFSFSFFPWAVLRLGYSFHFPVRRLNGVRVNFSASVLKSTPRTRENCQFFLLMSLCLQFVVFPIMFMVLMWNIVIQRMSNMLSSFYFLQPSYYFPSFVCNHK
uniref:Uncharacterized protein n=1 Tax=Cacopsylla melanoneura TaxID=428564 RepID=A0A8D8Z6T2_9HEMI